MGTCSKFYKISELYGGQQNGDEEALAHPEALVAKGREMLFFEKLISVSSPADIGGR